MKTVAGHKIILGFCEEYGQQIDNANNAQFIDPLIGNVAEVEEIFEVAANSFIHLRLGQQMVMGR